jgi:RNA recognition motif-containing protein
MPNKLYVGNLAWSVNSETLGDYFKQCGSVVNAFVIMDKETGKSRGFGFVEMGTDKEAQKAIEELHGTQLSGRELIVRGAVPEGSLTKEGISQTAKSLDEFIETATIGTEMKFTIGKKQFTLIRNLDIG